MPSLLNSLVLFNVYYRTKIIIMLHTFIVFIHILYTVAYFMHCMISLTMPMLDLSMSMCLSLSMPPYFLSMLARDLSSSWSRLDISCVRSCTQRPWLGWRWCWSEVRRVSSSSSPATLVTRARHLANAAPTSWCEVSPPHSSHLQSHCSSPALPGRQ